MAPVADLFNQKVEGTAWKTKPTWYIAATKDRTVPPDLQRFASKRMGANTIEVDSSHVPMLSHPNIVLDVIRKAAVARSHPSPHRKHSEYQHTPIAAPKIASNNNCDRISAIVEE